MSGTESRTSIHVYNARCALTIEPTRNRRGDVYTVNIEAASRPSGEKTFDWKRKVVVQVTGDELPDVLAVLLDRHEKVEFLYHGAARDKGYRLFHDGDRLVVQLFAGERERHTVSLSRSDRLRVATMLFRQLQRNHGGLPADVLYAMLTRIYRSPHARLEPRADSPGPPTDPGTDERTPPPDAYDW